MTYVRINSERTIKARVCAGVRSVDRVLAKLVRCSSCSNVYRRGSGLHTFTARDNYDKQRACYPEKIDLSTTHTPPCLERWWRLERLVSM